MAFYKVVLNGSYAGQDIKNILYYRTGIGFNFMGLTLGGASTLADLVRGTVCAAMKIALPTGFVMQDIEVTPYDDLFQLVYTSPHTLSIHENGQNGSGTNGPATCFNIHFNLEPTLITVNGVNPPKRGYVAIGPVVDADVNNEGIMDGTLFSNPESTWNVIADQLSQNLENFIPPVIFYPIRMKFNTVLGVSLPSSWCDVDGAFVDRRMSFRRSRLLEA